MIWIAIYVMIVGMAALTLATWIVWGIVPMLVIEVVLIYAMAHVLAAADFRV